MVKASEILTVVTDTFNKIGRTHETTFPGLQAKESAALEYVTAKILARLAVKRLELAEKNFPLDNDKVIKGQEVTVWRPKKMPPSLILTARCENGREPLLNKEMLTVELRKRFSQAITDDIIAKSSKPCEPRVTYSVVFLN